MLKHIALFKFNKFESIEEKENYYNRIKDVFDGLEDRVPAIKSLQIGFDELQSVSSYDFVVNVVLENMEALPEYMNHPEHVKTGKIVRERMLDKKTIDYEF
tara:strand:- start:10479 stop:10781 length:303 start_codon:yes stop_codon:yes gene_type:complete